MNEGSSISAGVVKIELQKGFGIICRRAISDVRLSLTAKGILGYLSTRLDGEEVRVVDMAIHSTDGIGTIYKALEELNEAGYIQ